MRLRLLALLLVPAVTVLVLAGSVLQERNDSYGETQAETELAALVGRIARVDQTLGEETLAGTRVIDGQVPWDRFLRRAAARTDRSVAELHVLAQESDDPQMLEAIESVQRTLSYRRDIRLGVVSPLQLFDRYARVRTELLDVLADRTSSRSEGPTSLQGLIAMIEARSAHLNERLATDLALTYERWAPGQRATAVGAIAIQENRIAFASNQRRRENATASRRSAC